MSNAPTTTNILLETISTKFNEIVDVIKQADGNDFNITYKNGILKCDIKVNNKVEQITIGLAIVKQPIDLYTEIKKLREDGLSQDKISIILGISQKTVSNYLKEKK